jgi:hypothetical protein
VTDRISKAVVIGVALALVLPSLSFVAYSRPGYFNSTTVGGLVLFECLVAAICLYRRIFFPLVVMSFLFAGSNLPVGGMWVGVRWLVLGVGAGVGTFIMLKERRHPLGQFHAFAMFAVLAAIVSAAVSRYQYIASLKALSLFLLFLYAGTGARLAVTGREDRFFRGLLTGCELFVGFMSVFYAVGIDAMGNPNSLGAVMGVVAAPILLWGAMLDIGSFAQRRRQILYILAMYLTFHSHSRAGLAAAFFSSSVLCIALRQYKLLGRGIVVLLIIVASSAIFNPDAFSRTIDSLTSTIVYKGNDPGAGVFASRESPWQGAMQSIHNHFWFGSGFGTTDNGRDATELLGRYNNLATSEGTTSENGSSFLSILSWVGVLGIVPFGLLLLSLMGKIFRTVVFMVRTGDPNHPAIPLAMVLLAGLLHAGFEDWLFAVGYYLCVFYWSLAFVLVDVAPRMELPRFSDKWAPAPVRRVWGAVAQSR